MIINKKIEDMIHEEAELALELLQERGKDNPEAGFAKAKTKLQATLYALICLNESLGKNELLGI